MNDLKKLLAVGYRLSAIRFDIPFPAAQAGMRIV
jgi:hypothetical protein